VERGGKCKKQIVSGHFRDTSDTTATQKKMVLCCSSVREQVQNSQEKD
jgi:hypothetical protein